MRQGEFRVEAMGESGALVTLTRRESAPALARELDQRPHLAREAWAAFDQVGVVLAPGATLEALSEALADVSLPHEKDRTGRELTVPVCYALGEDLPEACRRLDLKVDEFTALHARTYRCEAVGFQPGFPYLGTLDARLQGLERRPTPRVRVEPGSVAIAGARTGVYPSASPGGWWVVGRTPVCLVDAAEGYFPIRAGDTVRVVAIDEPEFHARQGERL